MTAADHIILAAAITYEVCGADRCNRWAVDDCDSCGKLGKYDSRMCLLGVCPECDAERWAVASKIAKRITDDGLQARWEKAVRARGLRLERDAAERKKRETRRAAA